MKIVVDHSGHELLNLGDISMLQTAICRLKRIWPEAYVYVLTDSEKRLNRFCPGTIPLHLDTRKAWNRFGSSGLFPKRILKFFPESWQKLILILEERLFKYYPRLYIECLIYKLRIGGLSDEVVPLKKYILSVVNSNLVIAAGGGYLTDAFKGHACQALDTIQLAIDLGKTTVMMGQGIGPVGDTTLEKKMRRTLPHLDMIALREKRRGLPILLSQNVELSRIVTTGDDAIEMAYRMRTSEIGNCIGLNFRMTSYSNMDAKSKTDVISIIKNFVEKQKCKIMPIPISFHRGGEDIKAIKQGINWNGCTCSMHDTDFDTTEKLIERISKCRLVVTGSYHAGVFALSQGIPVIGLVKSEYYQDKFLGLADQFGNGCRVFLMDKTDQYKSLFYVLEELWNDSSRIRPDLLRESIRQIDAGKMAYRNLKTLVEAKDALKHSQLRKSVF